MATPTSQGSLLSQTRSHLLQPVRASVYVNGAGAGAAGRRVVLDRGDSLAENCARVAAKLGLEQRFSAQSAKLYTKQGIALDDVEEVIEAEVLFFAPFGEPFWGAAGEASLDSRQSFGGRSSLGSSMVDVTPPRAAVAAAAELASPRGAGGFSQQQQQQQQFLQQLPTATGGAPPGQLSFGSSNSSVASGGASVASGASSRRRRSVGKPQQQQQHRQQVAAPAGSISLANNSNYLSASGTASFQSASFQSARPVLERQNSFEYDYLFKFILVGSVAVGKSCMLLRFTDQTFRAQHETTIGVDFGSQTLTVRGSTRVKIQIWDTAGQEYFKAITRAYFREAAAALVVYDVTNRGSFNDLKQWLDNVRGNSANRALTVMLVGNKADRPDQERQVSAREGEAFARENGLLFFECSALNSDGSVREAFARTAEAVLRKMDQGLVDLEDPSQGVRRGDFNVDEQARGRPQLNVGAPQAQRPQRALHAMGSEGAHDSCYC